MNYLCFCILDVKSTEYEQDAFIAQKDMGQCLQYGNKRRTCLSCKVFTTDLQITFSVYFNTLWIVPEKYIKLILKYLFG